MDQGKYSIELWNSGQLLADLSGRADGRSVIRSRNQADQVTWSLDLHEFERYCELLKLDPKTLVIINSTEVRVKRLGKYLAGGQVNYAETVLSANGPTISLRAIGFLNLFKKRYTSANRVFSGVSRSTICSTLITESQTGTNRDFGITIGTLASGPNHDETFKRENVKNALQGQTERQSDPIDIEITAEKVFNTYNKIGSNRPDIIFEYPGNIKPGSRFPLDGTDMTNRAIVLGSGSGDLGLAQTVVEDLGSQANYKVREDIVLSNARETVSELEDDGESVLASKAFPVNVPSLKIDGNKAPYITDYGLGDYVKVRVQNSAWLEQDSMRRVEKYSLAIDSEDNEDVTLEVS